MNSFKRGDCGGSTCTVVNAHPHWLTCVHSSEGIPRTTHVCGEARNLGPQGSQCRNNDARNNAAQDILLNRHVLSWLLISAQDLWSVSSMVSQFIDAAVIVVKFITPDAPHVVAYIVSWSMGCVASAPVQALAQLSSSSRKFAFLF